MFETIDSVTLEGWGSLLMVFIPNSGWLLAFDAIFFVLLPAGMLFGLLWMARKWRHAGGRGTWMNAGAALKKCFWLSVAAMAAIYFAAHAMLGWGPGGTASFAARYRNSLPGAREALEAGKKTDAEICEAIAERIRNRNVSDRKENPRERPEYKAVSFFCRNFGWLHPFFLWAAGTALLGRFFMPGFAMSRERTKI